MTAKHAGLREPARDAQLPEVRHAVQQLIRGRSNATGTVTLTVSAGSTTVTAKGIIAPASVPVLTATTAHAAGEFQNGTIYVSAVTKDSFTITHANNAQADRTFLWSIQG